MGAFQKLDLTHCFIANLGWMEVFFACIDDMKDDRAKSVAQYTFSSEIRSYLLTAGCVHRLEFSFLNRHDTTGLTFLAWSSRILADVVLTVPAKMLSILRCRERWNARITNMHMRQERFVSAVGLRLYTLPRERQLQLR